MTATVPINRSSPRNKPVESRTSTARPEQREYVNAAAGKGTPLVVMAFLFSLLVPFIIPIGSINLQPHRIVIMLSMPYLLMRLMSGRAGKVTAIDLLFLFSGLWCAFAYTISYRNSPSRSLMDTAEFGFSYFFELYGGFLIARVGIRNAAEFQRVTRFVFYCVLVAIPLAAIEAITHKAFLIELLGRKPAFDTRFGMRRAQVVFGHPILYGAFASTAMGLVWYTFRPNAVLAGQIGRSVFVFIALFFSFSVGAILSFMVQTGSIAYERIFSNIPKRWTLFAIGVVASYIFVDLVSNSNPFQIFVRYLTFNPHASYIRVLTFEYGIDNIKDKPIFGFGTGGWIRPPGFPRSIDNFWLLMAMQFGLPAFLALATAVVLIIRRLARKSLVEPLDLACRAGVLTAMGGIVVAGATVHYWQGMLSFVMFIFGSGVWLLSRPDAEPPGNGQEAEPEAVPQEPAKKRFVPYGREG